jgi:hypothetical protein
VFSHPLLLRLLFFSPPPCMLQFSSPRFCRAGKRRVPNGILHGL